MAVREILNKLLKREAPVLPPTPEEMTQISLQNLAEACTDLDNHGRRTSLYVSRDKYVVTATNVLPGYYGEYVFYLGNLNPGLESKEDFSKKLLDQLDGLETNVDTRKKFTSELKLFFVDLLGHDYYYYSHSKSLKSPVSCFSRDEWMDKLKEKKSNLEKMTDKDYGSMDVDMVLSALLSSCLRKLK